MSDATLAGPPAEITVAGATVAEAPVSTVPDRLLVFGGDSATGLLIGRVARRAGFDVIVTADPTELEQRVRSWNPATIILDLGMPDAEGIDMLRFLAEAQVSARILMVSGFDDRILDAANRLGVARGLRMGGALPELAHADQLTDFLKKVALDIGPITKSRLAEGLEAGELYLDYQPKIELATMRPVGVEALVRWKHPELGIVPPLNFIPIAKESDLIHRLTWWVLGEAIRQREEWAPTLPITVAVNLSARNVEEEHLADLLARAGAAPNFDLRNLIIELTESAAMHNAQRASDMLNRLRVKGIGISIDDFGTGYSSLVQLQNLPFSEVKIDKSFVLECATSKDSAAIVFAIIDLSHRLGLKVVAEGVETRETLDLLAHAGCDVAQGYFIGKPMGAQQVPAWMAANPSFAVPELSPP